ncbi:hypothetical protein ACN28S_67795 [Cystobacter fuscus]
MTRCWWRSGRWPHEPPSTSLRAAAGASDEQQQTPAMLLRALKLPAFAAHHEELAVRAGQEGWTCPHYLRQLVELG